MSELKIMELDFLIILLFLAVGMIGIHIFFNPVIRRIRKREREGDGASKILERRPYATRRKKYRRKYLE